MTDKKPTIVVIDKAAINNELGIETLVPESSLCIAFPTQQAADDLKKALFAKKIMGGVNGFNGKPDQFEEQGVFFLEVRASLKLKDRHDGGIRSEPAKDLLANDYEIKKVDSIADAKKSLTDLAMANVGVVQGKGDGRSPA